MDQMPGFIKNALEVYDLGSPDAIVDSLGDKLNGNVDAVAQTISDKVIRPVAGFCCCRWFASSYCSLS